eukprot:3290573-Pleurochrysis_carterae.AAC.3
MEGDCEGNAAVCARWARRVCLRREDAPHALWDEALVANHPSGQRPQLRLLAPHRQHLQPVRHRVETRDDRVRRVVRTPAAQGAAPAQACPPTRWHLERAALRQTFADVVEIGRIGPARAEKVIRVRENRVVGGDWEARGVARVDLRARVEVRVEEIGGELDPFAVLRQVLGEAAWTTRAMVSTGGGKRTAGLVWSQNTGGSGCEVRICALHVLLRVDVLPDELVDASLLKSLLPDVGERVRAVEVLDARDHPRVVSVALVVLVAFENHPPAFDKLRNLTTAVFLVHRRSRRTVRQCACDGVRHGLVRRKLLGRECPHTTLAVVPEDREDLKLLLVHGMEAGDDRMR